MIIVIIPGVVQGISEIEELAESVMEKTLQKRGSEIRFLKRNTTTDDIFCIN